MSLITCPECGKQISDSAPSCPNCGYQTHEARATQPAIQATPQPPRTAKPDNGLIWGILTTLFCCMPFGIVSIVYSAKVDSDWNAGRYDEAAEHARQAMKWAKISALIAVALCVGYLLFWIALFGVGIAADL